MFRNFSKGRRRWVQPSWTLLATGSPSELKIFACAKFVSFLLFSYASHTFTIYNFLFTFLITFSQQLNDSKKFLPSDLDLATPRKRKVGRNKAIAYGPQRLNTALLITVFTSLVCANGIITLKQFICILIIYNVITNFWSLSSKNQKQDRGRETVK